MKAALIALVGLGVTGFGTPGYISDAVGNPFVEVKESQVIKRTRAPDCIGAELNAYYRGDKDPAWGLKLELRSFRPTDLTIRYEGTITEYYNGAAAGTYRDGQRVMIDCFGGDPISIRWEDENGSGDHFLISLKENKTKLEIKVFSNSRIVATQSGVRQ